MPADNVNVEALTLVVSAAKKHIERMDKIYEDCQPTEEWELLKTAVWMMEQVIEKNDLDKP
jgi:hypothetical protein